MAEIKIVMPSKREKGFLRRQREAVEIQERLRTAPSVKAFDDSVNWLLRTAVEVTVSDGSDPFDALLDLSEEEFDAVMTAARGGDAVNPPNGG